MSYPFLEAIDTYIKEQQLKGLNAGYWPFYVHPELSESNFELNKKEIQNHLKNKGFYITDFEATKIPIIPDGRQFEIFFCWDDSTMKEAENTGVVFI